MADESWFTSPDVDPKPISMPTNFGPNAQHRALAIQLGIDLEEAFATFCDHHAAKGNKFLSWDRAFNTWLRREQQFARRHRPCDRQFLSKVAELPSCPIGFCDGSGRFVDRSTRRWMDCECGRKKCANR